MTRHLLPAAILAVGLPIILFAGAFTALMPSGSPDVIQRFQDITAKVSTQINWMDVYMFEYFVRQNDFENITDTDIENAARRFIKQKRVRVTGSDGKAEYDTETIILSLLDVMTQAGYTHDDYEMAISLEEILRGADMPAGPIGDISVPELRYTPIPPEKLYDYVHQRGSIFTLQDIQTIEAAAQAYDINPALLIAITGQEESFVPANWPNAQQIRNNPFNVYHSWQEYNTTLADSAMIAANTIYHKLLNPPPQNEDAIQWLNDPLNPWGIYAEDPHWAYGVEDIFHSIEAYINSH
ncbi:glucosaminidase domain-containing protein [Alicyclobacillus macrosporangiidus]|uniref:Mannosyl-glycoprotein endo-beta-N-acetylglucosaminidase n=1 Tax=Alicyclobacillus macrosporangiidus TaxID=392015 RepID=A0A1I7L2I6_9BACL|nr:glucosaminidase domain-containing protein [Alicyclobacillus macrosporangiidus]SFV03897.1 Mannosyl-glycoprotein endo-beta-N-acetylglucosaminidase [Alicyclobacillus macrosporangiidus]